MCSSPPPTCTTSATRLRSRAPASIQSTERTSCVASGGSGSTAHRSSSVRSDLDAVTDLELGEPAQVEQLGHVLFAAERGQHAGEIAEGGDSGTQPLADVLAGGGAAEILVAARSLGLGD